MIEDSELRDLFRIESSEHIQAIEDGLLKIEKDPGNPVLLEELFREAHSLKGASRMLDLGDIEVIFHRFEDILGKAKSGRQALSSDTIDSMHRSLDAVRRLVEEAVSAAPANVVVTDILASLQPGSLDDATATQLPTPVAPETSAAADATLHAATSRAPSADPAADPSADLDAPAVAASTPGALTPTALAEPLTPGAASRVASTEQFVIETIRVETRKLDMLMTHAGELTVAKTRIARRHMELEELQEKWDQIHLSIKNAGRGNGPLNALLEQYASHLEQLISAAYEDSARLEFVTGELEAGIRSLRLLPLSTIFNLFGSMVRKLSREMDKDIHLIIEGGEITADKRILEEMKDPLMHILRNAVDHGIELPTARLKGGKQATGTIHLRAHQTASNIQIEIEDDGCGLDIESIKRVARKSRQWREEELSAMSEEQLMGLIFMPGFSTSRFVSDVSGRGVGMDVVRTNVAKLKGTVTVRSVPNVSCTVSIKLPLTLSTTRVLIVVAKGIKYAVPVEFVQKSYLLASSELFTVEGHLATLFEDKAVAVAKLLDLLAFGRSDFVPVAQGRLAAEQKFEGRSPCVIMDVNGGRFGLIVDELLDEQEIVLKAQSALLKHVSNLSGVTILGTGEVCMVLNPPDFLARLKQQVSQTPSALKQVEQRKKQWVLLAEDSLTTRAQMKRILEANGYEVVAAVDGQDAYGKLETRPFDAIVSDINMPNMDGLALTTKVRSNKKYSELPIILVTMLSTEDDKKRGMEAGANAYISKANFDQKTLVEALGRLV